MQNLTYKPEHGRMPKTNILIGSLFLSAFLVSTAEPGILSLETYYPSPQGAYDRITLLPQTSLPSPCEIGSVATLQLTGNLRYCRDDGSGTGVWGSFNSVWDQDGDNVYVASSINDTEFTLNIGSDQARARFYLENDGGILAMGDFGTGLTLPDYTSFPPSFPIVSRFIWYPRRAIFRAMEIDSNSPWATNDGVMGDHSVAFGLNNFALGTGSLITSGYNNQVLGNYSVLIFGNGKWSSGNHSISFADVVTNFPYNYNAGNYATQVNGWSAIDDDYGTIGGGWCNNTLGIGATLIGGNQCNDCNTWNYIPANFGTIGGGQNVQMHAHYGTIGGGRWNWVGLSWTEGAGSYSSLGGGQSNVNFGAYATLLGGYYSQIEGAYGVLGGGGTSSPQHWIMGDYATVAGGIGHYTDSSSLYATILGGYRNSLSNRSSVIAGGQWNTINGSYSTASGSNNTVNADYSWFGGFHMTSTGATLAHRSFVWGYNATDVNFTQSDSFVINSGKVGIRETAPSGILSITGDGSEDFLKITSSAAATPGDIFVVKANGYVGIGNSDPQYPLQVKNLLNPSTGLPTGYLSIGGVFTDPSSRQFKDNIKPLNTDDALTAARELQPVTYRYKANKDEHHVGFIAEDVPEFVASKNRDTVDPMNITAVLTAVVKEHKKELRDQRKILDGLENELQSLKDALHTR